MNKLEIIHRSDIDYLEKDIACFKYKAKTNKNNKPTLFIFDFSHTKNSVSKSELFELTDEYLKKFAKENETTNKAYYFEYNSGQFTYIEQPPYWSYM